MSGNAEPRPTDRLDRWLWHARFFKTRTLAARVVSGGGVRINGTRATKPSASVGPGDVLTFAQARAVRVIRIAALGSRRGPATEAQGLYKDLDPPASRDAAEPVSRVGPRPTKKARRKLDGLHDPET